jgi:hypothetical protein
MLKWISPVENCSFQWSLGDCAGAWGRPVNLEGDDRGFFPPPHLFSPIPINIRSDGIDLYVNWGNAIMVDCSDYGDHGGGGVRREKV